MIRIDDYMSLRLIMWSFPSLEEISRKEAYDHLASKWEYVYLRSLEDHEIDLINSLIDEFGPLVPQYRTFQTYSADRPYTSGRPIERVSRPWTPRTIKVTDYPQLHKSILPLGVSDHEISCNEAFLWYTEHWYDIDLGSISDHEKRFINELISEFGPILPSINPEDEDEVGDPIISV